MNEYLQTLGENAKRAAAALGRLTDGELSAILLKVADKLESSAADILAANAGDVKRAEKKGVSAPLVDRLRLNEKRIADFSEGIRQISRLETPVGQTVYSYVKENGLKIEEKRVPFGVIGIIFQF